MRFARRVPAPYGDYRKDRSEWWRKIEESLSGQPRRDRLGRSEEAVGRLERNTFVPASAFTPENVRS